MQLDMHFYGVYALARAAGIQPETARRIAFASQFVDDAVESHHVELPDGKAAVLPIVTSHKPTDFENAIPGDQWAVWVSFHFLPGNEPDTQSFMERMVCRKGSAPARQMLQRVLQLKTEPFAPHLAGIAAHVYADTYAHYGFVGLCSTRNKVKAESIDVDGHSPSMRAYLFAKYRAFKARVAGTAAEILPLGHGSVATFPDRPFLNWRYEYEDKSLPPVVRNNSKDFLQASQELHAFFGELVRDNPTLGPALNPVPWSAIETRIQGMLQTEGKLDDRVELWEKAIARGELFPPTELDRFIRYSDRLWNPNAVFCDSACAGSAAHSDPCLYVRAATMHRDFVLRELLPRNGILVS